MKKKFIANLSELKERTPTHALVHNVDLVIMKDKNHISVLYGRCLHRGALLADGFMKGKDLICPLHGWDYRFETGISAYNPKESLKKFSYTIDSNEIFVDEDEIAEWEKYNPQPYDRESYLGNYQDIHGDDAEPYRHEIQSLSDARLETGGHGPMVAMGVELTTLPRWDDIQVQTAQLHKMPLLDGSEVSTRLIIGPKAQKPLILSMPIFVSDMSFGSLSEEAKISLARGAELAGTGICSGEGGMLPEEQIENTHYFYEMGSGQFGFSMEKLNKVQAFHFKAGQAAKTGTGGHLPAAKNKGKISQVRGVEEGTMVVSPSRFKDLSTPKDFRDLANEIRRFTGGIPVGFKISANHIEESIDFSIKSSADYIILDGRGGATGAAPALFRNHISIPTIPALARARKYLDKIKNRHTTLIVTGGLRTPADFFKALCLGADGIAIANSALQAIGCQAMRACHTDNCPVGIATQKPELRKRLDIERSARNLANFLNNSVHLMETLSRACGHNSFAKLSPNDLTTMKYELSKLTGIKYAGVS